MRHDRLKAREGFDIRDAAAIWAGADAAIQHPLSEIEQGIAGPTSAVPDVPASVGTMLVLVYATLIAVFFLTMAGTRESAFMIAISAIYVTMFLGVPRLFLHVERDATRRPSLARFLAKGIDTHTGHMSGAAALAQMFVVPLLLTLAILCMGITGLVLL
jgi:hypothetical protein